MLVESYEVTSVETEIESLALEGEALELIESLNLEGQRKLINPETKTINPFRRVTKEELLVFKALFPEECALTDYADGPVPVEVLRLAKKAKDTKLDDLKYLQVWHAGAGYVDPILVGRKNYYSDPVFLIARWGSALAPFVELKEEAIKAMVDQTRSKFVSMRYQIEQAIRDVDTIVRGKMAENEKYEPYIRL